MERFWMRTFLKRSAGMGVGATASVLLAGCVVDRKSPEICDMPRVERAAKCPPATAYSAATGAPARSDY